MNKIFEVITKGKRRKEGHNTVCCVDEVSCNHSSRKIDFQNSQFDSDHCSTLTANSAVRFSPKRREKSENRLNASPSASWQSFTLETRKDCNSPTDVQSSTFPKFSELPGQEPKQWGLGEKSTFKKQIYAIQISNSKSFHVGPQKTININEELSVATRNQMVHSLAKFKLNFSRLMDCNEKLSENYIVMISQHLEKKWKEFGRNLGLKESFLEEQEIRNNGNGILITYDMLHEYISQFPKTSLGFIMYVLSEINCIQLTELLVQNLGSAI